MRRHDDYFAISSSRRQACHILAWRCLKCAFITSAITARARRAAADYHEFLPPDYDFRRFYSFGGGVTAQPKPTFLISPPLIAAKTMISSPPARTADITPSAAVNGQTFHDSKSHRPALPRFTDERGQLPFLLSSRATLFGDDAAIFNISFSR